MWDKFTERARRVIFFAQQEAGRFGENHVSTEHLLLGLIREPSSIAVKVLKNLDVSLDIIRAELDSNVKRGEGRLGDDMQLAPRAKRVIDLAYDEARELDNSYIGTEHLLLGLIHEREGIAAKVLARLGVTLDRARVETCDLQERRDQEAREQSGEVARMLIDDVGFGPNHPQSIAGLKNTRRLRGRSIMSILDLSTSEIDLVLGVAELLKRTIKEDPTSHRSILPGRTLAMIFEKPSLRTRVTFETGMTQLGGHAIYLAPTDISIGVRETVEDVAKNLSRWCNVIMARVFSHDTVTGLTNNATIPVINGLSDLEHPCQVLADFQTIKERKGEFNGLKLAFIGDGNNVANSLMLCAAKVGTHFSIACPEGYEPGEEITQTAREIGEKTGSRIEIVRNPAEAAEGADVLYADVWASMGQEAEQELRKKTFASYQINSELMAKAKPDAIVLHCLPAHRGDEITSEVLDGPQSAVFDEAENRLHAQKALLSLIV
ncbi:MAG: ornithine carbamoyltransferase [Armatimonadota bacterium]